MEVDINDPHSQRDCSIFLPDECRVPIFDDVGEILRYNRFHVKFYVRQIKGENQENV